MITRRRMLVGTAALSGTAVLSGTALSWPQTLSGATDAALTSDAQVALLQAWDGAPEEMAYFDALNEASKTAFLTHAAKLEGLKDSSEVQKRSRWRHLPHWIESYWLPVRSDTATDGPVFFGSTYGLLTNLADMAAA